MDLELRRIADHLGHPQYEVFADGKLLGRVFGYNPTFEREIPGKMYVASRWTSKRRYWCSETPDRRGNPYRLPYDTRKRAVESLLP